MKKGFTLIELLTVIAIIAILAAIIFPVAGTVREQARRSACISNLKQIFTSLELYKLDAGAYPPALFGYAVDANGTHCPNNPLPMEQAPSFLMPYIKNVEVFKCPNNIETNKRRVVQAVYPVGHAAAGNPVVMDPRVQNSPQVCFYAYDSYDIGRIGSTGSNYELHYSLFWTDGNLNAIENNRSSTNYGAGFFGPGGVGPKASDNPRQLIYRNPDKTAVVTWCSYHRSYRGNTPVQAKDDLVLFLNGDAKPQIPAPINSLNTDGGPYHRRP